MKKYNKLSEEDLNQAHGGTILHNPNTGEYIVGEFDTNAGSTLSDQWKPIASTYSKGNAQKIANVFDVSGDIVELRL